MVSQQKLDPSPKSHYQSYSSDMNDDNDQKNYQSMDRYLHTVWHFEIARHEPHHGYSAYEKTNTRLILFKV